jgi:hypothetical protein
VYLSSMAERVAVRSRKAPVRHSIEEMNQLADSRGGICLSDVYHSLRLPLYWRCKLGHRWWALAGNVLRGSWCPVCARRLRKSIEEMHDLAASRGGKCLSTEYRNRRTPLEWSCASGHSWTAPAEAILAEKWCFQCSLIGKYTIEDIRQLAIERGGRCASSYYVNLRQKIDWECSEGHTWRASTAAVLHGTWCPVCAQNQRLEIEEMRRIAMLRGGQCLSFSYVNNHTPLLWCCREGHKWLAAPSNVRKNRGKRETWCPVCADLARRFQEPLTLKQVQEIAIERGGRCLSEQYLGSKFKLTWQCALGHIWQAMVTAVRRGSWCPECAGNRKLDIALFHRLATERGGLCLSDVYVNKDTPLLFQCSAGHQWKAPPGEIKGGSWCSICARATRQRRFKPQTIGMNLPHSTL